MSLIVKAMNFAYKAHSGQFRKYTKRPYIEHPCRVAAKLMLVFRGHPQLEEIVAAGWLHDVVEDTKYKLADLRAAGFSEFTVYLVEELTNPSKQHPKASRADRKRIDREHIALISQIAQVIKLVDRLDNLTEMQDAPEDFIRLYTEESQLLVNVIQAPTYRTEVNDLKHQISGIIYKLIGSTAA